MAPIRKPSILLDPVQDSDEFVRKIIPTFRIPWVHRDLWNDKNCYYPFEGKIYFYVFIILLFVRI